MKEIRWWLEHGAIEGRMELAEECLVVTEFDGTVSNCVFINEGIRAECVRNIGNRVTVGGTIATFAGVPGSLICVSTVAVMRDRSQLPQIEDLPELDITGGEESSEYIRRLRGEDSEDVPEP